MNHRYAAQDVKGTKVSPNVNISGLLEALVPVLVAPFGYRHGPVQGRAVGRLLVRRWRRRQGGYSRRGLGHHKTAALLAVAPAQLVIAGGERRNGLCLLCEGRGEGLAGSRLLRV